MWNYLKTKFEKKDCINAIINFGNLTRLTLSNAEPMEGQLAALGTQRTHLALNGFKLNNHVVAALILLTLPPSFKSIKTHFLDGLKKAEDIKINTVTAWIIEKDQRARTEASVNLVAGPSNASTKPKTTASAPPRPLREGTPPGPCFHCRKVGHWNQDCKKKKKKQKQKKLDQSGGSSSLHVVESTEPSGSTDASKYTLACYLPPCEDWLMDSGATEHLTPQRDDYKTYQAYPKSRAEYVTLGDSKTRLRVHGMGTVERWAEDPNTNKPLCLLTLTNVLHVPGIKRRFLSLSTFDNKGFELHIVHQEIYKSADHA